MGAATPGVLVRFMLIVTSLGGEEARGNRKNLSHFRPSLNAVNARAEARTEKWGIPYLRSCSNPPNSELMKIHNSMKCAAALLGSLAMAVSLADAKPGKGNSEGKGKGGNAHSQKAKKDKGPDHAGKAADKSDKHNKPAKFARFNDNERTEIVDYFGRYRNQEAGLPPGLAKNQRRGKPLPPGWQKKLVPGYRIHDDEWTRYDPVPSEWFPRQRMEPNTRLYHYGDRVVRVYEPRREVIDVIILPVGR